MVASGFSIKLGVLSALPAFLVLFTGDLVGDALWYALGYHVGHRLIKRFGRYVGLDEPLFQKISGRFHHHQNKILFFSKITMGFGFALATLITAGISRVSFKKFIALNFLGGLVWISFLLFLGYTFGNFYLQLSDGLRITTVVMFVVLFLLAIKGFGGYMQKRFLKKT